jgi:hypothetical protein
LFLKGHGKEESREEGRRRKTSCCDGFKGRPSTSLRERQLSPYKDGVSFGKQAEEQTGEEEEVEKGHEEIEEEIAEEETGQEE